MFNSVSPFECYEQLENLVRGWVKGSGFDNLQTTEQPWNTQPMGSQNFDEQASIQIPSIITGWVTVMSFIVPLGMEGVIKNYAANFTGGGFQDGSGDLVWRLLQDKRPIRNFDYITTERGSPESPRSVSGGIRIYSGQLIEFQINHVSNNLLANGFIICGLSGYFYPNI